MMQVKTLALAIGLAAGAGFTSFAEAAPLVPAPIEALGGRADVTSVAFGCGPGFTRGRFGRCRPIFGGYGYGRPRFYGGRHFYGGRRFYGGRGFGGGHRFGHRGFHGGRGFGGGYRGGRGHR